MPGAISIWSARGEWEHIKLLKGHTAAVNAIAVHPTGTIALSTSRDRQMRLWDLVKGSCAYQAPLGAEGDLVTFLPGGKLYAVGTGPNVTLHTTQVRHLGMQAFALSCSFYYLPQTRQFASGCRVKRQHR